MVNMHASWKIASPAAALLVLVLTGAGCAAGDDAEEATRAPEGAALTAQEADSAGASDPRGSSGSAGVAVIINQNGWDNGDTGGGGGGRHHHGWRGHHGCSGHGFGGDPGATPADPSVNTAPGSVDQGPAAAVSPPDQAPDAPAPR
jgi:hypothetical protein